MATRAVLCHLHALSNPHACRVSCLASPVTQQYSAWCCSRWLPVVVCTLCCNTASQSCTPHVIYLHNVCALHTNNLAQQMSEY